MKTHLTLCFAALALVSCGPPTRTVARDATVARACGRYQTCGEIASGKTYDTRDQCDVQQRSYWEGVWPAASCEGKINSTQLDTCWKAIDIADCTNVLDLLNIGAKCDKSKVCVP